MLLALACNKTDERRTAAPERRVAQSSPAVAGALAFPLQPPPLTKIVARHVYPHLPLERPVFLTVAPGDRDHLYVVEQSGTVLRFPKHGDGSEHTEFLDIRGRVRRDHNEEGLLGLAFAPDYERTGVFYVFYSASEPRRSLVSRLRRGDDGRGDPDSEEPILAVPQPFGNHNGGTVSFGPDGYLYAGFGDGGSAADPHDAGQDRSNLLGTIVRIAVESSGSYRVPTDNPFVGEKGVRPEIWAFGLRNPWRFSFDRQRGELWAADVGQDNYEEVDRIVRGGNYGWRIREGTHPFAESKHRTDEGPLLPPVVEYGRGLGESITGGYVYRGLAAPSLRGSYVYADFVSGNVWAVPVGASERVEPELIAGIPAVSSFGEDADGELYALSFERGIFRFDEAEPTARTTSFPRKLSETGLFTDLAALTPSPGLQPYAPNVELWSDGAIKRRWVVLPQGGRVTFSKEGEWTFPIGTVTVKQFDLPLDDRDTSKVRRLETRVMVHERDGWSGYTYRWDEDQKDAVLLTTPTSETLHVQRDGEIRDQTWFYPAGNLCLRCHTESYGRVLGLRTRQLRRGEGDLITRWQAQGVFDAAPADLSDLPRHPDLDDESAGLEARARAYLDVNCALCHNPDRDNASTMNLLSYAALEKVKLVDEPASAPLGLPEERRIHPGKPESSALWIRMQKFGPEHMPPLASQVVDVEAVTLLRRWIESMAPS